MIFFSKPESLLFKKVPAYRLATFRVVIAVVSIFCFIPQLNDLVHAYRLSAFHIPMIVGIPASHPILNSGLILIMWVAAWALLFGIYPRSSAAILATVGLYIFLLDMKHYNHNLQFHIIILSILAFTNDGVSLFDLCHAEKSDATCEAWCELLILYQIAIVFFYAALEKIFSPFWGTSGIFFVFQQDHPLDWIRSFSPAFFKVFAGPISIFTIAFEFFIATAFLLRLRHPLVLFCMFWFFVDLEILTRPGAFAWSLIASLILFFPAADRIYGTAYHSNCNLCSKFQYWVLRFDWLRRIDWIPMNHSEIKCGTFINLNGKMYVGYEALKKIMKLFPGPIFIMVLLLRYGMVFVGLIQSEASIILFELLMSFLLLLMFVPAVSDFSRKSVGQKI